MKRYYRVDEVACYFSVSESTIYRLIDMGDLKAIRLRDCIRVPAEELLEFEERQRDDS
jgi:excisionase family DNA binding protein